MDVSPEYIKMCQKADEIHGLFHNDIISLGVVDSFFELVAPFECKCGKYAKERYKGIICDRCGIVVGQRVWLPRQDQLQEMILLPDNLIGGGLGGLLGSFYDFLRPLGISVDFISGYCQQFTSMEQLWLAFVMNKRYQKCWDFEKENWVKIAVEAILKWRDS